MHDTTFTGEKKNNNMQERFCRPTTDRRTRSTTTTREVDITLSNDIELCTPAEKRLLRPFQPVFLLAYLLVCFKT